MLRFFILNIILVIFINQDAYAYLDGSTGSMLLQIMFGGIAGSWFIIKMYWSKIKAYFLKLNQDKQQSLDVNNDSSE